MSFPLVLPVDQLDQHLGSLKSQGKTASEAGICLVDLRSAEAYAVTRGRCRRTVPGQHRRAAG